MPGDSGHTDEAADATSTVCELLSDTRRRSLLRVLDSHDRAQAVADIAIALAEHEHGASIEEIPHEEVRRIYISLHHAHIPKLADADAVTIDRDRNTVALTGFGERLRARLDCHYDQLA